MAPEIVSHFHVYQPSKMLLQWYDAFDLPMYVTTTSQKRAPHLLHQAQSELRSVRID